MSPELAGIFLALCTAIASGMGASIARLGLVGTPVVAGTVISMLAGSTLLLCIALPRYPATLGAIEPAGWMLIAVTAVINYPIGRLLLFSAMRRIGVAGGNTIVSANPIIASIIAVVWLGERLGPQNLAGILACACGAVLVGWAAQRRPLASAGEATAATEEDPHLLQSTTGVIAALGAMLSYGGVSVLIKKIVTDVAEPVTAASLVFSLGGAFVTLAALPRLRQELAQIRFRRAWQLVLGGSIMSFGIFLFYNAASRAPITSIAPVVAVSPIIAILFSQLIARRFEILNRYILAGAGSIVAGVVLIAATA